MTCGIYVIRHVASGRCYVGQSRNIEKRWREHRGSKEGTLLHRALRKYGNEAFDWTVLETCDPSELLVREVFWIDRLGTLHPKGFNLTTGGEGVDFSNPEVKRIHQEAIDRLRADQDWVSRNKKGVSRKAKTTERRKNVSEGVRLRYAGPDGEKYKERVSAGVRRSYGLNPQYRELINHLNKQRSSDPDWKKNQLSGVRRKLADQKLYGLRRKDGLVVVGRRVDFKDWFGITSEAFCELLSGSRKTSKGWELIEMEKTNE